VNQNHPPKIKAMLDRMELVKTDFSGVTMSISLDGNIRNLPETDEIRSSVTPEDTKQLLTALNVAFSKQDLTRVNALYSYAVLFPEKDQAEIRQEISRDFLIYINGLKNETEVNALFLHPGFSNLVTGLNNKEVTDLQFKIFSRYHLDDKTTVGKRVAAIQKNLPLNDDQKKQVTDYLNEIRAEKEKIEQKKDHTKTIIVIVLMVVLLIIRLVLRANR
jgi:preprotein translocase subunit SecE